MQLSERAVSRMTVVCSDESRNGKTLMARVIADHLLLTGRDPHVFDCDQPRGDIVRFFPSRSSLIDLDRTSGQIRLFDTALADPGRDYVVDLPAHGLDPFFTVIDDLDFINAAHDAGLELFIVFMLDKTMSSLMTARDLHGAFSTETFYLVRNAYIGNAITSRQARDVFDEIEPDGEFILPKVDREALAVAEEAPFSFSRFATEGYVGLDPMVRLRLRSFLSDVMAQLQSRDLTLDMGSLKNMGLI
jgi:hypothetical protein